MTIDLRPMFQDLSPSREPPGVHEHSGLTVCAAVFRLTHTTLAGVRRPLRSGGYKGVLMSRRTH